MIDKFIFKEHSRSFDKMLEDFENVGVFITLCMTCVVIKPLMFIPILALCIIVGIVGIFLLAELNDLEPLLVIINMIFCQISFERNQWTPYAYFHFHAHFGFMKWFGSQVMDTLGYKYNMTTTEPPNLKRLSIREKFDLFKEKKILRYYYCKERDDGCRAKFSVDQWNHMRQGHDLRHNH